MKILHVITSLHTGGAEKLMVDLLPKLKAGGLEVDLCVFNGEPTPFYEEIKSKGIKVIDFGIGNSVYSVRNIWRLRRIMANYDIVHTHNTSPQYIAAIANIGLAKKLITTEHSTYNRRRRWILFRPLDRMMYSQYKYIICISPKTKEALVKYIADTEPKAIVVYNGISISAYHDAPKEYFENNKCRFSLMQVAGFRAAKDQDTLIEALKYLPEYIHLFLVGDGVRRNEIEELIEKEQLQKRVHLLGISNNIPSLIKSADIVVVSSHWEGFGLAAVEGMAAGKPVIASDVDGLREVVNGAGILFPHGDTKALAKEIMKLATDSGLYEITAKACECRAKQFDISRMAEGYENIYVQTLLCKESI